MEEFEKLRKIALEESEQHKRPSTIVKDTIIDKLLNAQVLMMKAKGDDRSEQARYWAIAITDLEKVIAFIQAYIK